jgi:hypothetical protein
MAAAAAIATEARDATRLKLVWFILLTNVYFTVFKSIYLRM